MLRQRLLVLCYHGVISDDFPNEPWRTRVATRVNDFRRQMATLCRLFSPVSANDVLDHVETGRPLPAKPVLITFDDGFRNNLFHAAPVLQRLGIPALIHVSSGHIGQTSLLWPQELEERIAGWTRNTLPMPSGQADAPVPAHNAQRWQLADRVRAICKRLKLEERVAYLDRLRQEPFSLAAGWHHELYDFLSWDEVRTLDSEGFSIGSHTVTHPILTSLPPGDLSRELTESKWRIERELSCDCPWIAYPNGGPADFSRSVIQAAEKAGYKIAFTLIGKMNPESLRPLEIDRVCIPGELSDDAFHARINGLLACLA